MPAVRQPTELLRAKGAILKNPKRFKGRGNPETTPLGDPSEWLADLEKDCWAMFKAEMWWLMESDRWLVEQACKQRANMVAGYELSSKDYTAMRQTASALCGSPGDRSKVISLMTEDDGAAADPTAGYFQ